MRDRNRFFRDTLVAALLLACIGPSGRGQDREPMIIQATARGTSTQSGKLIQINIHIDQYSTAEDRQTLINAFNRSGQDGLVDALERMKGKGRFSTPYGVGNDVKYIIELPPEKGRRHIRLVTDRRIPIGEAYAATRSKEYSVGAVDLFLTPEGKGSEGTALPACRLTVNKRTQQIEVETFQNPWNLTNLMISNK